MWPARAPAAIEPSQPAARMASDPTASDEDTMRLAGRPERTSLALVARRFPRTTKIAAAALLIASARPALADGVHIEDASPAQLRAAQKTFEAADELYDGEQYEAAIKAFRTSFEIVASPNSQLMIARAMRKLGNLADAYVELESAMDLATAAAKKDPKYEPTAKAVREELAALKGQVGVIHLRLSDPPAGTSVTVADRPVQLSALARPVIVAPGTVVVVARAEGHAELSKRVDVAAGQETTVDLELAPLSSKEPTPDLPPPAAPAPAPTAPSPLRTAAFVAGGGGAVGLVGFVVFGAMHHAKFSDLEDSCPNNRCTRDRQDDIDSGKTDETLANVGLVIGVLGAGAGVTLFILSGRKSANAPPASSASLTFGPGSLRLTRHF